ncbi:MAG: RidA family protein [Pseudomonadota bacterium]
MRRISSGGPWEGRVGYCRAVVHGGMVHVAGTTAAGPDVPEDVVAQCRSALSVIGRALSEAGTDFSHAVRVRYILPDPDDFEPCWPVLTETFGANPPVATMIVAGLVDEKFKIEIELDAALPE